MFRGYLYNKANKRLVAVTNTKDNVDLAHARAMSIAKRQKRLIDYEIEVKMQFEK